MIAAGALQCVLDELGEAFALDHRFELDACLDASVQGCVRRALERLAQARVTGKPDGEQVTRIEGEVQEGREVAEELERQVLRFVDDPHGQQLFALDELLNAQLQVTPQLGTPIGRLQPSARARLRYRSMRPNSVSAR